MGDYLLFATAFFIAAVAPGADTLLILSRALTNRSAAWISGLGITIAKILMVSIAYLGLSAALTQMPTLLTALKIFGASFLVWRAWKFWTAKEIRPKDEQKGGSFLSAFAIGFSNPQPFAFYLSIVPIVVATTELPILLLIVGLGFGFVTSIYVFLSRILAGWLKTRSNFQMVNRILAAIFLLLALVILLR